MNSLIDTSANNLYFLKGGGEMGALTRAYDWSKTSIGSPQLWPQSLRTTVATILSSKFPMFLWWGDNLLQFYNDAYRPSLGNEGKHPTALGQNGKDCWPEIWTIIHPLIEQVLTTGEPTWSEDQLIPIYRNGKIEDVYWTFGYSAIIGETEKIEGVLVVCTETTEKVNNMKRLQESEHLVRSVVENAPFPIAVYEGEEMKIIIANQVIKDIWGKGNDVIGKSYREVLPEIENQGIFNQVRGALESGLAYHAKNQRVDLLIENAMKSFYFNYSFTPLTDTNGNVYGVMNTAADVTDLNLAKAKIQESENKLRNTILQAPIAMCIFIGPDHVVELANERMFELWGKPGEVFMNKPLFEGLYEAKNQGFEELLDKVYNTGETVSAQGIPVTLPRNGGLELVYVNILYQPYRDLDDKISGVLAIAIDVTTQMVAHKKIEEAEEKARLAINSAELGVYEITYSTDEIITDIRFREIWGLHGEATRNDFASRIHPDDLPIRKKAHETSLITGQLDYQARIIWPDNSIHWVRITGKVIFDEQNQPIKLTGIIQDITNAVTARKKIEESERSIRNMVIQAPVAMCIFRGAEYVVEIANNKMFELWGKEPGEVMHKPIFTGLPESKGQGIESMLLNVYQTGERFVANERPVNFPRHGKLEKVYINFVYEAMRDADESVSGILAVAIDVTSQVIARQEIEVVVAERTRELANANSDLQKSNAELAQFAYIASHDLQEPLRKITTFSQMLEKSLGPGIDESSKNFLKKISDSASRMHKLIRDVLKYSELIKQDEIFETTDLNTIAESILWDYELLIEEKDATINLGHLPVIDAIPLQMSQLFGNIIGNALKFASKIKKPVINISSHTLSQQEKENAKLLPDLEYIQLQFADNGIGFKKEYADQIFHIFQRLHRKSEYEGTGIGLAMCKKIAINHKGELNAYGSSEEGAVFNVILSVKQKEI